MFGSSGHKERPQQGVLQVSSPYMRLWLYFLDFGWCFLTLAQKQKACRQLCTGLWCLCNTLWTFRQEQHHFLVHAHHPTAHVHSSRQSRNTQACRSHRALRCMRVPLVAKMWPMVFCRRTQSVSTATTATHATSRRLSTPPLPSARTRSTHPGLFCQLHALEAFVLPDSMSSSVQACRCRAVHRQQLLPLQHGHRFV